MNELGTISTLAQRIRLKEISPVEVTTECLGRIEKLNPRLNAFITVMAESALAEARDAEAEIFRGRLARTAAWDSDRAQGSDRYRRCTNHFGERVA